jgi:hypothetical protein
MAANTVIKEGPRNNTRALYQSLVGLGIYDKK